MIVTDKFSIVHVPKTGGVWIRSALREIAHAPVLSDRHAFARPSSDLPHYGVFRDPCDWYRSLISFSYKGSDRMRPLHDPICEVLKTMTVRGYMNALLDPTDEQREKIKAVIDLWETRGFDKGFLAAYKAWIEGEGDFYSVLTGIFLEPCDCVIRYETLQDDIAGILDRHGYSDQIENVKTTAPINVTTARLVIPEDIKDRIRKSCAGVVERYGQ